MTTFNVPLITVGTNGLTGDPTTDTKGYVNAYKVVYLGPGTASKTSVSLPPTLS